MSDDTEQVYSAENAWMAILRMEGDSSRGYQGKTYHPEGLVNFAEVDDIRTFVEKVLAHLGRDPREITVMLSQGYAKAQYLHGSAYIMIPRRERGGGWAMNSAIVLHEMAHHLAGPCGHERPFRLAFVRLLEDIGQPENARLLQACYEAHGLTVLSATATEATIERIGKVLRQAESASTEGEREVFLAKAQEMATRHSVTLASARAHQAKTEERSSPIARTYKVGEARQRGLVQRVKLIMGIGQVNSVKFTIFGNNAGVTMYGFAEDIDLTIALYESVHVQMVTDCEAYLATDKWRGEKVWSDRAWNWVDISKITARLAFYDAYQHRIARRLATARETAYQEILATKEVAVSDETSVVLRDKEIQVRDAFTEATKHIKRSWSGGTRSTDSVRGAAAGDKAARSAALGTEKALS